MDTLRRNQWLRMLYYSRFLLRSIFDTFLRPPLTVFLILQTGLIRFPASTPLFVRPIIYGLSIPVVGVIDTLWSSRKKAVERAKLNTLPIPKIQGKKFGNTDVLKALINAEQTEYPGDIFLEWAKEYGPTFDMNILWASQIVTLDPENVRFLLSTEFPSFEKGEKFHDMFESFWGEGIFTTDGETWKKHRANARPFFAQERLSDFTPFEKHMDKVLDIMESMNGTGQAFDMQNLFARYTLDTATEFLFGSSTECLDGFLNKDTDAPYDHFMTAFNEVASLGATRIRIGSTWPLFELTGDKSRKPTRIIDAFVSPIVDRAILEAKKGQHEVKESNFLEYLSNVSPDKRAVRDESLNILFAARDTTSSLLTFTGYVLSKYPEVREKVRSEVLSICGPERVPTIADIKKMKYLEAVLNETLRLFPPVPYNIRRSIGVSSLPSPGSSRGQPYFMPARSSITWVPILIQRDPDVWGEGAAEFNPDRWLSYTDSAATPATHPSAFMPFNMGPRICLGQQLAYVQASYVWSRILQRFPTLEHAMDAQPSSSKPPLEWTKFDDKSRHATETIWPDASITLRIKGGFWLRIKSEAI